MNDVAIAYNVVFCRGFSGSPRFAGRFTCSNERTKERKNERSVLPRVPTRKHHQFSQRSDLKVPLFSIVLNRECVFFRLKLLFFCAQIRSSQFNSKGETGKKFAPLLFFVILFFPNGDNFKFSLRMTKNLKGEIILILIRTLFALSTLNFTRYFASVF